MKKWLLAVTGLCLLAVLAACGAMGEGQSAPAEQPTAVPVTPMEMLISVEAPSPTPTPTPTPSPTPTPTPTPEPTGKALKAYQLQQAERAYFEQKLPAGSDIDALLSTLALDADKPMIALTFDDGPSTKHTGGILDVLEQYNARVTFYVVGERLEKHQEVVARAINMNCEIGSHTWGHSNFTKYPSHILVTSLQQVEDEMQKLFGYHIRTFRPTYASINADVEAGARKMNYPMILWSGSTHDWSNKNASLIYKYCMEAAADGAIILFHDLYDATVEAIGQIVPDLVAQGYQLVTVSELMYFSETPVEPGTRFSGLVDTSGETPEM